MPRVTNAHRESRRRQILDASIECFAREGFHRTSMAQIIAEAGVSAGTIYLYFTSKEEIVEAIAEERHVLESALASTALANPDTGQALHGLAAGYLDWLSDPLEQKRRRVTVDLRTGAGRRNRGRCGKPIRRSKSRETWSIEAFAEDVCPLSAGRCRADFIDDF